MTLIFTTITCQTWNSFGGFIQNKWLNSFFLRNSVKILIVVSSNNDPRIFFVQSQFTSMILISDLQWSEWIPLTVLTHQTRHLGCKGGGGDGKQSEIKWRQLRVHPSFLKSSQRTMLQKIPICDRLFIAQETKTRRMKFEIVYSKL